MKNWNQLFVRHGWLLEEIKENTFDCRHETEDNMLFLTESLLQANVNFDWNGSTLILHNEALAEKEWIEFLEFEYRGRGGHLWFRPGQEEPKVRELDTYICGIVRQLNRLGYHTNGSCDGHGRRTPHVSIVKGEIDIELLVQMLLALGMKRVHYRESQTSFHLPFPIKREELLDLAEKMNSVDVNWLSEGYEYIKEQLYYKQIEELLSTSGESGNEEEIRNFVKVKLTPYVDYITVDRNGNLLAEKTYRSGNGPTILLNAHLDIYEELEEGRRIIKENEIWSSSKGILGADDRAGVAVLLHIAEKMYHTSNFSGKIKFIFTTQEEIGLVGARNIDEYFLWGTDAAIVVDRRGKGDIVTSCGGFIPFCEKEYGQFIETVAKERGLEGWKCTAGGSSDTRIWAEHGIQSVNLSVGYNHEHTDEEYLDIKACYETSQLVLALLDKGAELRRTLNRIKRENLIDEMIS